ncbi:MAG: TonB-dependent receptor [Polyangiaceae bacterium]|nr:TonB-dependent receptor [Polyangiaceae bacterium]
MSRHALSFKLAVACTTLALARPVLADDELDAMLAEPVVETASKTAEAASTAPAQTTVITAEELRRFGIRSLDEAINFLSAGMVLETAAPAAEIGARGVLITQDYGSHVLLLIDGHAINEVWGGTAYFERGAGIPLEIIDHIEVIVGPGSVLYGSNAMLGVINVVTKRARDFEGLHFITESEVFPGPAKSPGWSTRAGVGTGATFDAGDVPGEITFLAEMYWFDGPAYSFGPQNYGEDSVTGEPRRFSNQTPPGIWGGVASQSYTRRVPSAYMKLVLGDFELRARAALFDRAAPFDGGNFDDPNNGEVDRWASVDARYRLPAGDRVTLTARLYGDLYDYRQTYPSTSPEDCLEGQNDGCVYDLLGIARWGGLELTGNFDWLADGRVVTLIGADGRVKDVESRTDIYDIVSGESPGILNEYEETELALGVYAQQVVRPVSWLAVNAGARLDIDERYAAHVSPRAAASVFPWRGSAFKAIYAKAFRGPTAFERYYADTTSQVPPDNLRPETVQSVEGIFEQRLGSHRLEFGGFRSFWSDLVLTQPLTPNEIAEAIAKGQLIDGVEYAEQTRNVSKIDAWGYTATIDGSADAGHFRYGASFTRAHAERTEPDIATPLRLAAAGQVFANARLAYDFGDPYPTIGVVGRFVGERLVETANEDGSEAVASPQGEARLTVSGDIPGTGGLSYRVSGGYAFADRHPYRVGPAYLDDGSIELAPVDQGNVAVGLRYSFVPW